MFASDKTCTRVATESFFLTPRTEDEQIICLCCISILFKFVHGSDIFVLIFFLLVECTQLEDPRLEWREKQEMMLREYLQMAHEVLEVSDTKCHLNKLISNSFVKYFRKNFILNFFVKFKNLIYRYKDRGLYKNSKLLRFL